MNSEEQPTENKVEQGDIETLMIVFKECHSIRRETETRETKVSLGTSALSIGFTTFLVKDIAPLSLTASIISISIVVLFTSLSLWFLYTNGKRLIYSLRILVSIETVIGLYKPQYFNNLEKGESVFPQDAKNWGNDLTDRVAVVHHIILVFFVGLACTMIIAYSQFFIKITHSEKKEIIPTNKISLVTPKKDINNSNNK